MKSTVRFFRERIDQFEWHPAYAWLPCRVGATVTGLADGSPYRWAWLEPIEEKTARYVDLYWTNRRFPQPPKQEE